MRTLQLQDFDFYEIHEAFAGQVLCTLKAWTDPAFCRDKLGLPGALGTIDRSKLNVKGGSLAIGHPFAATGTRIVATLAKILDEAQGQARIDLDLHGGRHGRHRNRGALTRPMNTLSFAPTSKIFPMAVPATGP